jgi:hypothetical protein
MTENKGLFGSDKLEQYKLIFDYIKFHIGLYIATPPVFGVVAEAFGREVKESLWFQWGLGLMILTYICSGIRAGWFMGKYINVEWTGDTAANLHKEIFSRWRSFWHHWLYWVGLFFGFAGLGLSIGLQKHLF